jgi:16S rRNA (guanine527-N7)-methyltransferase
MSDSSGTAADLWSLLNWQPNEQQLILFRRLQTLLKTWNNRVNLTRLVDGDDFWINQVFDSLWPLQNELNSADRPRRCIDVGTGGGFPGLAIAIALPGAQLVLLDSVSRKTAAVAAMAEALGLSERVEVRTERIETTAHDPRWRNSFDLAMARAVASAPVVAEYLVPMLQPEGAALLYRGQWSKADGTELDRALHALHAKVSAVQRQELPGRRGLRHVLRVHPTADCPKRFPRAVGLPTKFPLGQGADDSLED